MCFYNDDYDWIAEVNDVRHERSDQKSRCIDCCRTIQSGEWRQTIDQQEHEECQICSEWGDLYDESVIKETCDHDYGETFHCSVCRECSLLREAIYDLEQIEGCPEYARQPPAGELYDAMNPRNDGEKYRRHALEKFPGLIASKILQH